MKRRERRTLAIGVVLIGIGALAFAGVLAANHFDFSNFAKNASFVRMEVEPAGEFDRVDVSDVSANVMLLPSEDETCSVHYDEDGKGNCVVEVRDGTLHVHRETKWYENILNINLAPMEVIVYLPEAEYRTLSVETVSGKIRIEGLRASEIAAENVSGSIQLSGLEAGQISANSTSGGIHLSAVRAERLNAETTSGTVGLSDFAANGLVKARTVSGGIRLENADAAEFELGCVSGNIRGTLNSDKKFDVHSVSGEITVPDSVETGGSFSASTTSGDIQISIGG